IEVSPAVTLWEHRSQEVKLRHLVHDLPREVAGLIPPRRMGDDLLFGELSDRLLHHPLLIGELKIHGVMLPRWLGGVSVVSRYSACSAVEAHRSTANPVFQRV